MLGSLAKKFLLGGVLGAISAIVYPSNSVKKWCDGLSLGDEEWGSPVMPYVSGQKKNVVVLSVRDDVAATMGESFKKAGLPVNTNPETISDAEVKAFESASAELYKRLNGVRSP